MVWRRICRSGSWTYTVTRGGSATSSGTPPQRTSSSVLDSTTRCDWLFSLTFLYIILFITPYSKNLSNSLYNWLQGVFASSFDRVFQIHLALRISWIFLFALILSFSNILFTLRIFISSSISPYIWWFCFLLVAYALALVEYFRMFDKEHDNLNVTLCSIGYV